MAVWGYTRMVFGPKQWAISIVGIILTLAAFSLFLNAILLKNPSLKWAVKCNAFMDKLNLEYTVIGIGFVVAAIGFMIPGTTWLGIIFAIVAAAFILADMIPAVKKFLDKYIP